MDEALARPGDLIGGRYRVESQLGAGGMGAVFAAVNETTGRAVAIKCLHASAARSRESLARFLVEARATSKIEHPNVIQILDVQEEGGAPFLVMERLRGQSLGDRLKRGALSVPETLAIVTAACRGVAAAHDEGIVHRDLKPDNIFLCEGKDGTPHPPKVLDFGISKLYEDEPGAHTRTGTTIGTPQYMSPEQLSASTPADGRFDVYSMGIVLYECLTGRRPYDAPGLFELVQEIAAGQPRAIRELAPHVPPELEAVVMRAMSNARERRHPTMKHLIRDLEQLAQGVAPWVPATRAAPVAPAARSKLPLAVGAAALAIAALLFVTVLGVGGALFLTGGDDEELAPPLPSAASAPAPIARPASPLAPDVDLRFSGACVTRPAPPYVVSGSERSLWLSWGSTPADNGSLSLGVDREELGTLPVRAEIRSPANALLRVHPQVWQSMPPIGRVPAWDPSRVGGAIVVNRFDGALSVVDVTFQGVTLQSANGSTCTIDGHVRTRGATWGP